MHATLGWTGWAWFYIGRTSVGIAIVCMTILGCLCGGVSAGTQDVMSGGAGSVFVLVGIVLWLVYLAKLMTNSERDGNGQPLKPWY